MLLQKLVAKKKEEEQMKVGYARVSRGEDQNVRMQRDLLRDAGCDKIFEETASGGSFQNRPVFKKMLDSLKKDDLVVVWKLDRLTRSLKDLLFLLEQLNTLEVHFLSLTEAIDTTTPSGRLLLQLIGSFAEFERAMVSERTKAGLDSAKRRGVFLGRPQVLNFQQREEIKQRILTGEWTQAEAARLFKVNRSTICRILQRK